jgi:predicted nucleic acid-binding protein
MKVVVSDTSPLNYLLLIGCIDILPRLYTNIRIPHEVLLELSSPAAPPIVSDWIANRPSWLEATPPTPLLSPQIPALPIPVNLDPGETAAIHLALAEPGSLLLIDEAAGREYATKLGIANTGTLGVLLAASQLGLVDLNLSLQALQQTSFRVSQSLIRQLLAKSAES